MGSNERLAYQASIIILFLIVIAVSVPLYMCFQALKLARVEHSAALASAAKADGEKNTAIELSKQLRVIIGMSEAASKEEIEAFVEKDMTSSGEALSPQDRNYATLVRKLRTKWANELEAKLAETAAKKDMQVQYDAREKGSTAQIAKAKEGQEEAGRQLISEKQKSEAELKRVAAEKEAQKQTMQGQIAQLQEQITKLEEERNNLDGQLKSTVQQRDENAKRVSMFAGTTAQPVDGEIKHADQRKRIVWINLGSADALPVPMTFSVYAPGVTDITKDTPRKGTIEVTGILQEHLAEARIVSDSYKDPILPGDRIGTAIWHPGRVERFAVAGFIDLNGDGQSDSAMLRNLIRASGGQVDAFITDAGKREGEMSYGTRYMVVGALAGDKVGAETNLKAISDATNELQKAGKALGVKEITLNEFLDMIGWTERSRVWNPTAGDEYKLRQGQPNTPPASTENVNEYFRKRRPPAGEANSAYDATQN